MNALLHDEGLEKLIWVNPGLDFSKTDEKGTLAVTTRALPADTCLASISFDAVLSPALAVERYKVDLDGLCAENLEGSILALYLIHERDDPHSRWRTYIDALPKSFDTPLYWQNSDLKLLAGTNLESEVPARRKRLLDLKSALFAFLTFDVSDEDWLWAHSVIYSRSFPSTLIDPSRIAHPILLPVLDTFNHKSPLRITWHADHEKRIISFISGSAYATNVEVYNNYGAKGNEELLMSYGFCLADLDAEYLGIKIRGSQITHRITLGDLLPASLVRDACRMMKLDDSACVDRLLLFEQLDRAIERKVISLPEATINESRNQRNARLYKSGQSVLACRASRHVKCLLEDARAKCAIFTLSGILKDTAFWAPLKDFFGESETLDLRESGLGAVIMTLYLYRTLPHSWTDDVLVDESDQALFEDIASILQLEPYADLTLEVFSQVYAFFEEHIIDSEEGMRVIIEK